MQILKLSKFVAFSLTITGIFAGSCETFNFRADGGRALCSRDAAYKWDGKSTSVTKEYDDHVDAKNTCDHVLQLNIAIQVIKSRFCPSLDDSRLSNEEKTSSLEKLKNIINKGESPSERNTFFVTEDVDALKGRAVEIWNEKNQFLPKMYLVSEKINKSPYSPQKLIATGDYLSKTGANSVEVAIRLDTAMKKEAAKSRSSEQKKRGFTLKTKDKLGKDIRSTEDTWRAFLKWYEEVVTEAEKEMNTAAQASNSRSKDSGSGKS
ncbi:hypothetical protein D9758_016216 [Tetrapyrgos nigripes]|uniref:Uncharacterized protein n=1 Tax=Tetrapyrgos nigripes TaxID=182062 RepID=A0A8H5CLR6_9AGAR|nr:hypothetical protein D9758_016216 [Tetrapyrgos nigripes]